MYQILGRLFIFSIVYKKKKFGIQNAYYFENDPTDQNLAESIFKNLAQNSKSPIFEHFWAEPEFSWKIRLCQFSMFMNRANFVKNIGQKKYVVMGQSCVWIPPCGLITFSLIAYNLIFRTFVATRSVNIQRAGWTFLHIYVKNTFNRSPWLE